MTVCFGRLGPVWQVGWNRWRGDTVGYELVLSRLDVDFVLLLLDKVIQLIRFLSISLPA